MQFIHSDSRHLQFIEQPASLEIFVADVKRSQPEDKCQSTATEALQRANDLFQLAAEERAHQNEASYIQQRPESIEKEKPGCAHSRSARQRRRQCAQAGNKFCRHHAAHSISPEKVLSPANARVRFKGNT